MLYYYYTFSESIPVYVPRKHENMLSPCLHMWWIHMMVFSKGNSDVCKETVMLSDVFRNFFRCNSSPRGDSLDLDSLGVGFGFRGNHNS